MKNNEITTIKIKRKTKDRFEKLRLHEKESYDEIVQRILNILNVCRANPENAQEKLERIEELRRRKKFV
ncbi:hypothetical protein HY450_03750 [Candidatus Pacearchaeota archaeon]|nr:hypothetical protein [Candidatus Pacearchaeota archaeon]